MATVDICMYLVTTIVQNLGRAVYASLPMSSDSYEGQAMQNMEKITRWLTSAILRISITHF